MNFVVVIVIHYTLIPFFSFYPFFLLSLPFCLSLFNLIHSSTAFHVSFILLFWAIGALGGAWQSDLFLCLGTLVSFLCWGHWYLALQVPGGHPLAIVVSCIAKIWSNGGGFGQFESVGRIERGSEWRRKENERHTYIAFTVVHMGERSLSTTCSRKNRMQELPRIYAMQRSSPP